MEPITRDQLQQILLGETALIEVLGREQFQHYHLPAAINVPLDDEFDEQIQEVVPDREQSVVVYCFDKDCDASSKAAQRLDKLGYRHVYDYEAGKADWRHSGLPVEA